MKELVLIRSFKGEKTTVARVSYNADDVCIKAVGQGLGVQFYYGETSDDMEALGDKQDLVVIADGNGNQFNGPGIGMYASANGKNSKAKAHFYWFDYKNTEND